MTASPKKTMDAVSNFSKDWEECCKAHADSRSLKPTTGSGVFLVLAGFLISILAIGGFHSDPKAQRITLPSLVIYALTILALIALLLLLVRICVLVFRKELWNPALTLLSFEGSKESQEDIEFLGRLRAFTPQELDLGKTWLQNRRRRARNRLGSVGIAAAIAFGSSVLPGRILEWDSRAFLTAAEVFFFLLMSAVYLQQPVAVLDEEISLISCFSRGQTRNAGC